MQTVKSILVFLLLVTSTTLFSQKILVSNDSKFSLLTCSPGALPYQYFGHTALRFCDPVTDVDLVFNYGIFDFNQKGFYPKFIKGDTHYMLGVYETKYFEQNYRADDTKVLEQKLNLTQEQRQVLLDRLLSNYEPKNRYYLYNFAYDNCATRPHVKIVELLSNYKLLYHYKTPKRSFREWIQIYTGKTTWLKFGIDLLFGRDADKVISKQEAYFLPEVLSEEYAHAEIMLNDSTHIPLVTDTSVFIASDRENDIAPAWYRQPLFYTVLLLLIGVILIILETKKKKYYPVFDAILFIVGGLVGVILFYLMFFSIHPMVKQNFNLLWNSPINLFVGIFILFPKMNGVTRWFQLLNMLLLSLTIVLMVIGVQSFNIAFLPIVFLLLIRTIHWLINYSVLIKK